MFVGGPQPRPGMLFNLTVLKLTSGHLAPHQPNGTATPHNGSVSGLLFSPAALPRKPGCSQGSDTFLRTPKRRTHGAARQPGPPTILRNQPPNSLDYRPVLLSPAIDNDDDDNDDADDLWFLEGAPSQGWEYSNHLVILKLTPRVLASSPGQWYDNTHAVSIWSACYRPF